MDATPHHAVAVVGGATAGAEVAHRLAERGILAVVFERGRRPFGKIEDGLPRWHEKLRQREYERIGERLSHPLVELVPSTAVGPDVGFRELVDDWGFAAVVLANGAWRDRPLSLGSERDTAPFLGRGLEYQNPFVIAFNHEHDASFGGRRIEAEDGAAVIGGGLAAIDVAKILNLSATRDALAERGIAITVEALEHAGIDRTLDEHGLTWDDLGLEGVTIYYRRRIADMPVAQVPEGADAARRAKVEATREKMIAKVRAKYLIEVVPLATPDDLLVEDDRVVGLSLRRTLMVDGRLVETAETFEARHPLVVSSIGSIPEPIAGVPMRGELYDFVNWDHGTFEGLENVFAAGNVLTGKGNIAVSRRHAVAVTDGAIEAFLGLREESEDEANPSEGPAGIVARAAELAEGVAEAAVSRPPLTGEALAALRERIAARQAVVGFTGDLVAWLEAIGQPC